MRVSIVVFPGSNCEQDCERSLRGLGARTQMVWHAEETLPASDVVVLPGGFAHGDYLRTGAIARFSPVMNAVHEHAAAGKLVIGICNGFQILCEAGLLPGALVRNRSLHFVCDMATVRVEVEHSPFTLSLPKGTLLRLPVAHGEGCYFADEATLRELNANRQVVLRYVNGNPNGSVEDIAGICNRERNVFGLMPHPDRACEERLGSADGAKIFRSMMQAVAGDRAEAA